jgi:hypothetical protein
MAAAKARKERMMALEEEARARVRCHTRLRNPSGRMQLHPASSRSTQSIAWYRTHVRTYVCMLAPPPQAPPPESEVARAEEDAATLARAEALIEEEADEVCAQHFLHGALAAALSNSVQLIAPCNEQSCAATTRGSRLAPKP